MKTIAAECSNSGLFTPPILVRQPPGKKRKREKKGKSLNDERIVSQALAILLIPNVGGCDLRIVETAGKLQIL